MINATPRPLYPRERDPVPIVQEAGWTPEPVCTRAEYLASGFDPRSVQPLSSRYPGPFIWTSTFELRGHVCDTSVN